MTPYEHYLAAGEELERMPVIMSHDTRVAKAHVHALLAQISEINEPAPPKSTEASMTEVNRIISKVLAQQVASTPITNKTARIIEALQNEGIIFRKRN